MNKEKTPDVEKEVKKQTEVEDLSSVDIGLDNTAQVEIYAKERFNCAVGYQTLYVRASAVRASVRANKAVGNPEAAEHFGKQLAELERDISHCLRGIKEIDFLCPEAKKRMQEMAKTAK
uniref:Uncharacterized protein n=1 Tax=viral metagenome TaxID=1070528 RepID=A0A6M3JVZ8_9ZZZZ